MRNKDISARFCISLKTSILVLLRTVPFTANGIHAFSDAESPDAAKQFSDCFPMSAQYDSASEYSASLCSLCLCVKYGSEKTA